MRNITRTIYAADLQDAKLLGINHLIPAYSDLNSALQNNNVVPFQPTPSTAGMETVESGAQPATAYNASTDTNDLKLNIYCIGNGGHQMLSDNGVPYTDPIPHQPSDSCAYSLIPFVVVPVASDLSPSTRTNYRLRKVIELNSVLYAAYFAKVLDVSSSAPSTVMNTVSNGITTPSSFVPGPSNQAPNKNNAIGAQNNGSYLSVTSTLGIAFSADDVNNLIAACELLYGSANFAVVSEIILATSVDKPVTGQYPNSGTQTVGSPSSGGLFEAIGAQASVIISDYYPVNNLTQGFNITLDVGTTEPLFGSPTE